MINFSDYLLQNLDNYSDFLIALDFIEDHDLDKGFWSLFTDRVFDFLSQQREMMFRLHLEISIEESPPHTYDFNNFFYGFSIPLLLGINNNDRLSLMIECFNNIKKYIKDKKFLEEGERLIDFLKQFIPRYKELRQRYNS